MKKLMCIFLMIVLLCINVFAAQINSANYEQSVIVSTGGENVTSSSYKMNIAVGIINKVIESASYINRLGFFHTLLLADNQPCTTASQCEGGFCCNSLCKSSACPTSQPAPSGGGGAAAGAAGGGGGGALPIEKDFSVSPSSIKEQLILDAAKVRTITIKNTGNAALNFDLKVLAINEFVFLSDSSFSLDAGQEKTVEVSIIGRKLGSYIGEIEVAADGIKKSIEVIIEVESEKVLFDVKVDVPEAYKEVEPGGELKAQITLLNVGPSKKVDVTPTYIIKDNYGRIIHETSETFAVEKQISYVKSFEIPKEALPGDHLIIVEVRYADTFAVSSDLFKVVPKKAYIEKAVKLNIALILALIVAASLIFLLLYLLVSKTKDSKRRKLEECYKALNEVKQAIDRNDIHKARKLYIKAGKLYAGLKNEDKKEVYNVLMKLYKKLR